MARAWYKENDRRGGSGMQAAAAGDPGASPGRGPFKQIDTMEQFNKLDNLYLLDCGLEQSSWRAWQKTVFGKARTFDRQLFTKEQIIAFGHHLDNVGRSCRNYIPGSIILPDWDFCKNYRVDPNIQLGPGCAIKFTRVAGIFTGK